MDVEDYMKTSFDITSEFIQLIDDHVGNLQSNIVEYRTVDNNLNTIFDGDFYGLLTAMGIPARYHYATLKVNNLTSSMDYTADMVSIALPDLSLVDHLSSIASAKK